MTITKKALFFLGAAFFLTCSSTYIKVQAAQHCFCKQTWHRHRKEKGNRYNFSQNSR